jgi:hypothetical protein
MIDYIYNQLNIFKSKLNPLLQKKKSKLNPLIIGLKIIKLNY